MATKKGSTSTRYQAARDFREDPIKTRRRARSPLSLEIAQRVARIRKELGIPQHVLEQKADLARGLLSQIESGQRGRMLTIDTVVRLAEALDVDLAHLITGKGKP